MARHRAARRAGRGPRRDQTPGPQRQGRAAGEGGGGGRGAEGAAAGARQRRRDPGGRQGQEGDRRRDRLLPADPVTIATAVGKHHQRRASRRDRLLPRVLDQLGDQPQRFAVPQNLPSLNKTSNQGRRLAPRLSSHERDGAGTRRCPSMLGTSMSGRVTTCGFGSSHPAAGHVETALENAMVLCCDEKSSLTERHILAALAEAGGSARPPRGHSRRDPRKLRLNASGPPNSMMRYAESSCCPVGFAGW
jgi:hypothetical protein